MSEKTNNLLNLFSKLLRNPNIGFAMRAEAISKKMQNRGQRNGAQGLLMELWKKDGLTNAEIAELLDIKPSSVTAQVKQLEESGLVERRQDENDKRVSRIFLTEQGQNAKTKRSEFHDDLGEKIFGSLDEEEQEQLANLLKKLTDAQSEQEFDFGKYFDFGNFGFGGPDMQLFGQQFRREMENYHQEMKRLKRDLQGQAHAAQRERWENMSDNERRQAMRDSLPFGEDWKALFGNMRERQNPWNFGPKGRGGKHGPASKDDQENWDDF